MKRLFLIVLIIFSVSAFAGVYKVYFKNGGFVMLKEKPDFSKKRIIGITMDGKKISFRKIQVDFKKTKLANENKKVKKVEKKVEKKAKTKITVVEKKKSNKKPLIITEQTIGRKPEKNKNKNLNKKGATSRLKNRFENWKGGNTGYSNRNNGDEEEKDLVDEDSSDLSGMSEDEARKYWRSQFINVNNAIENTTQDITTIQDELNKLMSEKLNTDDNIVIMKLNKEIAELKDKKKKLEIKLKMLKKKKEDLKDKARRAGALPGWYRDLI